MKDDTFYNKIYTIQVRNTFLDISKNVIPARDEFLLEIHFVRFMIIFANI